MRLDLGTAALARPYAGRPAPSRADAIALIQAAHVDGCRLIDTAPSYGTEAIIGDALADIPYTATVIVTKVDAGLSTADARVSLAASRRALRVQQLPIVLLHNATVASFCRPVFSLLRAAQAAGEIGAVGASVYDVTAARAALDVGCGVIQAPYNLRDQRFRSLFDQPVTWVLRSPWLRGTLARSAWQARFALRFALTGHAHRVLVGVRSLDEWQQAVATEQRGPLPAWQATAGRLCASQNPAVYDPRTWAVAS